MPCNSGFQKWHGPLGKKSFITPHERSFFRDSFSPKIKPLLVPENLQHKDYSNKALPAPHNLGKNHNHISSLTQHHPQQGYPATGRTSWNYSCTDIVCPSKPRPLYCLSLMQGLAGLRSEGNQHTQQPLTSAALQRSCSSPML